MMAEFPSKNSSKWWKLVKKVAISIKERQPSSFKYNKIEIN